MTGTSACYKCGQPGHYAADCPLALRALTYADHLDRLAAIVGRWIEGELITEAKRCKISDENIQWHGNDCPRALTYP